MKKAYFIFVVIFTFLVLNYTSEGQERTIKGYVTTYDSIPLINAEVMALSNKQSVFTDSLGNFKIECLPKDKLKVTAKGFISQKVKIDEEINFALVNLNLKSNPNSHEIAVGYGHVKDADKLFAMSSLHNEGTNFSQYSNMYDLIRGQIPGVEIVNKQIIVRGKNSINGSSAALIVVDGAVGDQSILESLRPINVKSVNVLKDGSTAIYGSRGASGVVLIEMKKGGE